ncbi:hypothetical protein GKQ23_13815 [Erwinia sp. E602]|uniref:hypothetical protein n=1 Tax=Erwinia sp. E602 TaxID=2675378 RepID=UPI001BACB9C9|nr:hypothetical protein [Erwinia sp. E602]QUG76008.1 hypothetical protein GKQ23_13815 [Erwinia sp. E602]
MAKSPAERKAAQRARQSASGTRKLELQLDQQEMVMLEHNCATRRPGREPYELSEYLTMLIRRDNAELQDLLKMVGNCGKCGDKAPVISCPCAGDSACWVTNGWQGLKLVI